MRNKLILAAVLFLGGLAAQAQELWTSAAFKTAITPKWGVTAEAEYRTHNQLKSSERVTIGAMVDYKHRYFKVDAGYKFMMNHTLEETTKKGNIIPPYWIGRHRLFASITGKVKLNRFEVSLRERYQYTHRLGKWVDKFDPDGTKKHDEWISKKDKHILRSRIAVDFNPRKCRFTPFASIELYNNLGKDFEVEKVRYTLGSEYKINRHNRVELFYRFVQSCEQGEKNYNVIGIGYTFKLK